MLWIFTGIIISYLIGSIPTAYIFGRMLKGMDIRKQGSGNIGATNAMRLLGKGPGITVLVLDILKGVLPVVFLRDFLLTRQAAIGSLALGILLGVSCIIGHNWTIFLQFKGGKGVATTLGVLIGLACVIKGLSIILGLVLLTWLIVFLLSRIVSLASLAAAFALPVFSIVFKQSALLCSSSIILAIFVILRHKSNLKRIFQGTEKRLF